MSKRERICWITGWAVTEGQLAAAAGRVMPDCEHEEITPSPSAAAAALASDADILGGFSFGAHLLLGFEDPRPRLLLAPFLDLKREAELGGAVATAQLHRQHRWFRRDARAAIDDFRARIGSDPLADGEHFDQESLAWSLGQMLSPSEAQVPICLPRGSIAVAGSEDPLLDTAALSRVLPGLHVVAARHQPHPLLAAVVRLRQIGGR